LAALLGTLPAGRPLLKAAQSPRNLVVFSRPWVMTPACMDRGHKQEHGSGAGTCLQGHAVRRQLCT
jgi:hypothetical protein